MKTATSWTKKTRSQISSSSLTIQTTSSHSVTRWERRSHAMWCTSWRLRQHFHRMICMRWSWWASSLLLDSCLHSFSSTVASTDYRGDHLTRWPSLSVRSDASSCRKSRMNLGTTLHLWRQPIARSNQTVLWEGWQFLRRQFSKTESGKHLTGIER